MYYCPNSGREKIKKRADNDLSYTRKTEADLRSIKTSPGFKSQGRVCVFRRWRPFFLFTVLLFLFGCGNKGYESDVDTIKARLDMIEERLVQLEKTAQRISPLEFQLNGLQESVTELSGMVAPQPDVSASAEKPSSPQDKVKVRYHEVRRGDTLYGVAQEYGLSVPELMKLNNLTKTQAIYPGQKLLVTPGNAE